MKRFIYLAALTSLSACALIACAGCGQDETVEETILDVNIFDYDGHNYLLFDDVDYRIGIVHDPDCPCHER